MQKIPKKVKNLRYFLRKKRNIVYKPCPMTGFFSRSLLNTTHFDSMSPEQKLVHWTVELIFVNQKTSTPGTSSFSLYRDCSDALAQVVLNEKKMVNEEQTFNSFVNKQHLKRHFINEAFSLMLASVTD